MLLLLIFNFGTSFTLSNKPEFTTMKKSSKSKSSAKSVTVSKSIKAPTAAQAKTRSMAAYKAHITRQNQIIAAAKSPKVKADARSAISVITANMRAA
jgi:hypothetical protein